MEKVLQNNGTLNQDLIYKVNFVIPSSLDLDPNWGSRYTNSLNTDPQRW